MRDQDGPLMKDQDGNQMKDRDSGQKEEEILEAGVEEEDEI